MLTLRATDAADELADLLLETDGVDLEVGVDGLVAAVADREDADVLVERGPQLLGLVERNGRRIVGEQAAVVEHVAVELEVLVVAGRRARRPHRLPALEASRAGVVRLSRRRQVVVPEQEDVNSIRRRHIAHHRDLARVGVFGRVDQQRVAHCIPSNQNKIIIASKIM